MAAHRYWRLFCQRNAGNASFTGLTEVEMATTPSGSDVTSTSFAIGSGSYQAGTATNAFNNDFTGDIVQWNGTGAGQYVGQDFGAGNEKDIVEVRVRPNKDAANRTFGQFFVQYSDDGSTWVTAWAVSYTGWVVGTTVTLPKPGAGPSYRYWRCRFETTLNNAFSIAEMAMRTTFGGTNECSGGTPLEASNLSGFPAANAFDGSSSTFWNSNSTSSYEYLGYDLGSAKQIIEMSLLPRQDTSFATQWPVTIYVEAGSDGINFLPIWTVAKSLLTYPDGAYTFRNPTSITAGSTHRWWGILPTTLQSGTTFGCREVEFRAAMGGADLTTGGIGGSWRPFGPANTGSNAFDSTTAEYSSASGFGTSDLIAYDYGNGNEKAVPVQLALTARASANNTQMCIAFDLVYSDDGFNWTLQQSFTTTANWSTAEQRTFAVSVPLSGRRMSLM